MSIHIKRIYEATSVTDGYRVLVDRLWPRGIKKETVLMDQWLKEVAPSTDLRKWFNHEPEKWKVFVKKYTTELKTSTAFEELKSLVHQYKKITLLYSAKNEVYNQAVVLKQLLQHHK